MLNITNLIKKNELIRIFNKKGNTIFPHRRDIPLSKEWCNGLYSFNKNPIRFLPAVHNYVFKLLKAYFNITNEDMDIKKKSRSYKKIRRSLGNKVWVSTPEIKHVNNKMTITVYIYNRLYNQYKKELNLLELGLGPNIESRTYKKRLIHEKILKRTRITTHEDVLYHKLTKKLHNDVNKKNYIEIIRWLKLTKSMYIEQYKSYIVELIKNNNLMGLNLLKTEHYNYLINKFKRELIYLKLKQKILFNRFKFKELYITSLINILQTIYKKKIELNVVVLKNYYLSSSILTQMIVAKVISVKNRGQPLKPINIAISGIKIPNLSANKLRKLDKVSIGMQNVILNNKLIKVSKKQDYLNKFLLTNSKKSKIWSSKYIDNLALKNLKNKSIAGIFIKIAGRLTKRYKAQRAVSVLKHWGRLKNVYSAHEGFSSALSRGYSNINVEKTMIHSKVRIGAFGLTGWIASY